MSFNVHIAPGSTIRVRSIDSRTGVTSNVFTGGTDTPTNDTLPGLEGAIYLDQNGNGKWDSGEPLQAGVGLSIADQNDQPLALQHTIEPDSYPADWVLNTVDSEATLSSVGLSPGTGDVAARAYAGVNAAGKVFTGTDYPNDSLPTWNSQQQLRVDFKTLVNTVSIRAYGISATTPSYARLDAYNGSGQVVARFNSGPLTSSDFTTMMVSRASSDIKYVIAYGWSNTDVVLDSLTWGPPTSTTSDSQGAFSLNYLPDGTYHIHVSPAAGYQTTNPATGVAIVTVAGGVTTSNMNFGVATDVTPFYKFHNYDNRFNVNPKDDSQITALDALLIINYINAHPGTSGTISPSSDPNVIGYIDVVPDGICAANDVLAIINYINAHPQREAEADSPAPAAPAISSGDDSSSSAVSRPEIASSVAASSVAPSAQPEGEYSVPSPQNAADYYAQQPVHLASIRGADKPCNCAACRAARGEAVAQLVQPAEQFMPPASNVSANDANGLDTALDVIAADIAQVKASGAA